MNASANASVIIDLPKDEMLIKIAKKRYSKIYVPKEVLDEHKKPKRSMSNEYMHWKERGLSRGKN